MGNIGLRYDVFINHRVNKLLSNLKIFVNNINFENNKNYY